MQNISVVKVCVIWCGAGWMFLILLHACVDFKFRPEASSWEKSRHHHVSQPQQRQQVGRCKIFENVTSSQNTLFKTLFKYVPDPQMVENLHPCSGQHNSEVCDITKGRSNAFCVLKLNHLCTHLNINFALTCLGLKKFRLLETWLYWISVLHGKYGHKCMHLWPWPYFPSTYLDH